jgi:sarcosine/dimethylglycine N-methyltransferase
MDLNHLRPGDLQVVEDFHTLGRLATGRLAALAEVSRHDHVLDAGSGIGGTARFLADHYGCRVTAVDPTEEFCDTARWLNRLVGLDDRISVRRGDVTELPFGDCFGLVVSQHVQMNIADKPRLYQQTRRVLRSGGRLALWDVTAGTPDRLDYPLPWADKAEHSHIVTADHLRALIESAGFDVVCWNDLTEEAAPFMKNLLAAPVGPLGLHAFVDNFAEKADNLTRGLSNGRLRVIQGVAYAAA